MLDNLLNKKDSYPFLDTNVHLDISYSIRDCRFFIVSGINEQPKVFLKLIYKGVCTFLYLLGDKIVKVTSKELTLTSTDPSFISCNSYIIFNKVPLDITDISLLVFPDCIIKIPDSVKFQVKFNLIPVFDPASKKDIYLKELCIELILKLNSGYNTTVLLDDDNSVLFSISLGIGKGRTKYFKLWYLFSILIKSLLEIEHFFKGVRRINGSTNNVDIKVEGSIYTQLSILLCDKSIAVDVRGDPLIKYQYVLPLYVKALQED